MQEEYVENKYSCDNERKEEVERKESSEGSIVYGEASSDPLNEGVPYVGYGGEKICDDGSTSERHLSSGKDVAYESGSYK